MRFTLAELLVVLIILLILGSLAAPGLFRVRAQVQRTVCVSNLRQIGMAALAYADDFDQWAMPGKFGSSPNYNHWINYLSLESVKEERVFRCPRMGRKDYFNPAGLGDSVQAASYIINIMPPDARAWRGAKIRSDPARSMGWGSSSSPVRLSSVRRPEEKLYIMDAAAGGMYKSHSGINKFKRTDHGPPASPPHGDVRWVGSYHDGGFNTLMGDGHVRKMQQSQPDQWVVTTR